MRTILLLLILAGLLPARGASFSLEKAGGRYTLVASGAPLSEILAAIDRHETATLRFYSNTDRTVHATFRDLPLEQLLDRLRVSFLLSYESDGEGDYRLGDAVMLGSDAPATDPGSAAEIRALVRNLRDDDIRWNAHDAYYRLLELGCTAVPYLEEALFSDDPQGRHIAANLLRTLCPEHPASERLIEVTLQLLNGGEESYDGELAYTAAAYDFLAGSNVYPLARSRILNQLNHPDPAVRLYSSLLAANHREAAFAPGLVRTLLPHLSDNDLSGDAGAAAYALRQLGPLALPQLKSARHSARDTQQQELLDLIIQSTESGKPRSFHPTMYVGVAKNPAEAMSWINPARWRAEDFPDAQGGYAHGGVNRLTARDYYGPWEPPPPYEEQYEHSFPMPESTSEETFPYRIKTGETVASIALKFSTPPDHLIAHNPGLDPSRPLVSGAWLLIPWE
ncbi:MAG TPA: LysM domain-containing protein [Kiritimatiellia bacterium]|nr:LysM domain-containing protein [Kiritimatiellia bacterium]HMP33477.1 LysM domain-containing protein [Kiritimatiellia bacterium]